MGKASRRQLASRLYLSQLDGNINAIWSLLVASGYLKIIDSKPLAEDRTDDIEYALILTNKEVLFMFRNMIKG